MPIRLALHFLCPINQDIVVKHAIFFLCKNYIAQIRPMNPLIIYDWQLQGDLTSNRNEDSLNNISYSSYQRMLLNMTYYCYKRCKRVKRIKLHFYFFELPRNIFLQHDAKNSSFPLLFTNNDHINKLIDHNHQK